MFRVNERNPLSDRIEDFILRELYKQAEPMVVLSRKDIAEKMECAPSQVTYVINTRFTPNAQFVVESRRGMNGFIRIAVRGAQPQQRQQPAAEQARPVSTGSDLHRNNVAAALNQYFNRLSASGMVTMRECMLMRNLLEVMLSFTPENRWEEAAQTATERIGRTIREGK